LSHHLVGSVPSGCLFGILQQSWCAPLCMLALYKKINKHTKGPFVLPTSLCLILHGNITHSATLVKFVLQKSWSVYDATSIVSQSTTTVWVVTAALIMAGILSTLTTLTILASGAPTKKKLPDFATGTKHNQKSCSAGTSARE